MMIPITNNANKTEIKAAKALGNFNFSSQLTNGNNKIEIKAEKYNGTNIGLQDVIINATNTTNNKLKHRRIL